MGCTLPAPVGQGQADGKARCRANYGAAETGCWSRPVCHSVLLQSSAQQQAKSGTQ